MLRQGGHFYARCCVVAYIGPGTRRLMNYLVRGAEYGVPDRAVEAASAQIQNASFRRGESSIGEIRVGRGQNASLGETRLRRASAESSTSCSVGDMGWNRAEDSVKSTEYVLRACNKMVSEKGTTLRAVPVPFCSEDYAKLGQSSTILQSTEYGT